MYSELLLFVAKEIPDKMLYVCEGQNGPGVHVRFDGCHWREKEMRVHKLALKNFVNMVGI